MTPLGGSLSQEVMSGSVLTLAVSSPTCSYVRAEAMFPAKSRSFDGWNSIGEINRYVQFCVVISSRLQCSYSDRAFGICTFDFSTCIPKFVQTLYINIIKYFFKVQTQLFNSVKFREWQDRNASPNPFMVLNDSASIWLHLAWVSRIIRRAIM